MIKSDADFFKQGATARSKALVKEVYYVLKHNNNAYYRFKNTYDPLKGLNDKEELSIRLRVLDSWGTKEMGDLAYSHDSFYNWRDLIPFDKCPNFKEFLFTIKSIEEMLRSSRKWKEEDCPRKEIEINEIIWHYLKYYFSKRVNRTRLSNLVVEYIFGTVFMAVFTILFFWLLANLSIKLALIFGAMMFVSIGGIIVALHIIGFEPSIKIYDKLQRGFPQHWLR
jgi:hypothetical protein